MPVGGASKKVNENKLSDHMEDFMDEDYVSSSSSEKDNDDFDNYLDSNNYNNLCMQAPKQRYWGCKTNNINIFLRSFNLM